MGEEHLFVKMSIEDPLDYSKAGLLILRWRLEEKLFFLVEISSSPVELITKNIPETQLTD